MWWHRCSLRVAIASLVPVAIEGETLGPIPGLLLLIGEIWSLSVSRGSGVDGAIEPPFPFSFLSSGERNSWPGFLSRLRGLGSPARFTA